MSNPEARDVLSWKLFYDSSSKLKSFPKKIELYNRLICHTENFFAIAGYGAFTKGYIIILTKELLSSFALIKNKQKNELKWFLNLIKSAVKSIYKRKVILFEHGMCACVGGLDRAHCHVMTINKNTSENILKKSINNVLKSRNAGIKSLEFRGKKLENSYDISQIILISDKKDYKINGFLYRLKDIQNLNNKKWPFIAKKHVMKGGHYVYFETGRRKSSFLTTYDFQTQMGREIVYKIELLTNQKLKKQHKKVQEKNPFSNVWRWQEFLFEENILNTMYQIKKYFKNIDPKKIDKFNFKFL